MVEIYFETNETLASLQHKYATNTKHGQCLGLVFIDRVKYQISKIKVNGGTECLLSPNRPYHDDACSNTPSESYEYAYGGVTYRTAVKVAKQIKGEIIE